MPIESINHNPSPIRTFLATTQQRLALVLLQKALDGLEGAPLDERDAWSILDHAGFPVPHDTLCTLKVMGFIQGDIGVMGKKFIVTTSYKNVRKFDDAASAMALVKSLIWMSATTEADVWKRLMQGKDASVVYGFSEVHISVQGDK